MYLKMWLRGSILLALVLLLGITLSACWPFPDPPPTASTQGVTSAQAQCAGTVAEAGAEIVIASLSKDREGSILDAVDGSTNCDQAIIDAISQPGNSNSLQITVPPIIPTLAITPIPQLSPPIVQVNQLTDSSFSYTYHSQTFSNCNSTPDPENFNYGIPLRLMVGTLDNNNNLQFPTTYIQPVAGLTTGNGNGYTVLPPTGGGFVTNNDATAQTVYNQYGLSSYFNQSDSFPLTLPANSRVTLHLPLTIDYRAGLGQVQRYGQAAQEMGWSYNYDFQRAFDPKSLTQQEMVVTSC